jgi:DNA-binding response OmpR family regulator
MSTRYKSAPQEKMNLPIFRNRKQGRVMLIEADSNMRQTLKLLLVSQGYAVYIAADIASACSMSRFKGYAFILFNLGMESDTGFDLCKQIRVVNKATPLFFYSNKDPEYERNSSIEANVQGCDAQSITAHAMLKAIFTSYRKIQKQANFDE